MRIATFTALFMLAASNATLAQGTGNSAMDHSAMGHTAASESAEGSTAAFEAANAKMHADMGVELTGDADVDFVRSMIPHHQGAIDMARIMLEYGDDPELKALAEEIITAQETEIGEMREWLAQNAPEAPAQ